MEQIDFNAVVNSPYALNLLLSLSRANKMHRKMLCDDPKIVDFLQSQTSEMQLKVITNLSTENKVFIKKSLPMLRAMCLDGNLIAL